ncbi:MAG: hypothetical protein ACK448_01195 [Bacteroidota bacterium]|jgi:hypothetical protein
MAVIAFYYTKDMPNPQIVVKKLVNRAVIPMKLVDFRTNKRFAGMKEAKNQQFKNILLKNHLESWR